MKYLIALTMLIASGVASATSYHLGTMEKFESGWFAIYLSPDQVKVQDENNCYNYFAKCLQSKSSSMGVNFDGETLTGTVSEFAAFRYAKYPDLNAAQKATKWRAARTLAMQCDADPSYQTYHFLVYVEVSDTFARVTTHDGLHSFTCDDRLF
jgi:hypothetical protein